MQKGNGDDDTIHPNVEQRRTRRHLIEERRVQFRTLGVQDSVTWIFSQGVHPWCMDVPYGLEIVILALEPFSVSL